MACAHAQNRVCDHCPPEHLQLVIHVLKNGTS